MIDGKKANQVNKEFKATTATDVGKWEQFFNYLYEQSIHGMLRSILYHNMKTQ